MARAVTSAGWRRRRQHVRMLTHACPDSLNKVTLLVNLLIKVFLYTQPVASHLSLSINVLQMIINSCLCITVVTKMLKLCFNQSLFNPLLCLLSYSGVYHPFVWVEQAPNLPTIALYDGRFTPDWCKTTTAERIFPLSTPPTTLCKLHSPYHYFFPFFPPFWSSPRPFYLFIPLASAVSWAINL